MSQSQYNPTGVTRESCHHSRRDGPGDVTLEVTDYLPEATSGFNEPGEAVITRLTFNPDGEDGEQVVYVTAFWCCQFREPLRPTGKTWINEAWAYESDSNGKAKRSHRRTRQVFQYSTEGDVTAETVIDDIMDNLGYIFP